MVDRELILRKLTDLEQYVTQVEEFREITAEEYRIEWKTQRIVERTLQMAIEACAGVANHIIADRNLRMPSTYAEAYEVLAEAGILAAAQREAMVRLGGLRNLIIHDYARKNRRWWPGCFESGWATSVPSGPRSSESCSLPMQ